MYIYEQQNIIGPSKGGGAYIDATTWIYLENTINKLVKNIRDLTLYEMS